MANSILFAMRKDLINGRGAQINFLYDTMEKMFGIGLNSFKFISF